MKRTQATDQKCERASKLRKRVWVNPDPKQNEDSLKNGMKREEKKSKQHKEDPTDEEYNYDVFNLGKKERKKKKERGGDHCVYIPSFEIHLSLCSLESTDYLH